MSFELIEAEKGNYPKALMCRALGLSRSGHHAFRTRGPSQRELEEQQLEVLVAALFAELGGRYGAPRIEQELRPRGVHTSKKRVAAAMARRRRGELLLDNGVRGPIDHDLAHGPRRSTRPVRFRRELLQRKEAAFAKRLQEPERNGIRLAIASAGGITLVSTESGEAHS